MIDLRVISGKYRGKKLKGFDIDGTRPTMDRVKESLFGMIQEYVNDSIVLDLFAGSGALGIEAISQGARKCIFIDNNVKCIKTIMDNVSNFDEDIKVINCDYKNFLKNTDLKFDIIFLDPPYRANVLNKSIKIIEERGLLKGGGIIVCEHENVHLETNLKKIKEKSYGPKIISILSL